MRIFRNIKIVQVIPRLELKNGLLGALKSRMT